MEILNRIEELAGVQGPLFLAIGVFDGVHLGHQALIQKVTGEAREHGGSAVVVTFDPHPIRVLRPDKAPRLLTSTLHKTAVLKTAGVDHLLLVHFDQAFSQTPPVEFVRELREASKPLGGICVGHEWSFGREREGNLDLLRQLGARDGFEVFGIPPVEIDGVRVSSTLVRRAVAAGDLDLVKRMLGRPYTIMGTVEHGRKLGRTIGFPTANLSAHSEIFPPDGVYAVRAKRTGAWLPGVVNLGLRPTVEAVEPKRTLELHLLDFDQEIYREQIEVEFVTKLRDEQKFENLDALKAQIAKDVTVARAVLNVN